MFQFWGEVDDWVQEQPFVRRPGLVYPQVSQELLSEICKETQQNKKSPTKLYESTGKPVKISSNNLISIEMGLLLCWLPTIYETGSMPVSRVQHAASFHPPAAGNNL